MARPISELERHAWVERFGLGTSRKRYTAIISGPEAGQLSQCRSDEARRLILGISKVEQGPLPKEEEKFLYPALFNTREYATALAEATQKATGDEVRVVIRTDRWEAERWTGSQWVKA